MLLRNAKRIPHVHALRRHHTFTTFIPLNRSNHKELTFVILEGDPIMSGKAKILARLNKMGYTTKSFPHLLEFRNPQQQQHPEQQQPQQDHVVEIEDALPDFFHSIQEYMQELQSASANIGDELRKRHKNSHIFLDASPLTAIPYLNPHGQTNLIQFTKEATRQLKNNFACKMYYCEADEYESRFRLGGHKWDHEQNKSMTSEQYDTQFRSHFEASKLLPTEAEIVTFMHDKYKELYEEKWFDDLLITTDAQQATCALLENFLDLQFKLPPRIPLRMDN